MAPLGHWLKKIFPKGREPLRLHVEGIIRDIASNTPRTHLGPVPAPREACFTLEVERAWLSDGSRSFTETVDAPIFTGPLELRDRFDTGDRVLIVCTTATGRLIEKMEPCAH
jgi:hypothetical protein